MKKNLKKVLLLGCLGIFGSFVLAQSSFDPMNMPKITSYVNDFSKVLSLDQLAELDSWARTYEQQTTNQFVTVLFPNRNGNELFDIGVKLYNSVQIGQAGKSNGLLLVISTEEKKIRIIVGYGLEGDLPDALVSRIIEQDIRPLVNSGDFVGAIRMFHQKCSEAINTTETSNSTESTFTLPQNGNGYWILGLILGFFLAKLIKQKKIKKSVKNALISLLILLVVGFLVWLGALILVGLIAGLVFGLTGFLPGRGGFSGGFGGGGFGGGGFSGGGFSGGGGSTGGGGAGD